MFGAQRQGGVATARARPLGAVLLTLTLGMNASGCRSALSGLNAGAVGSLRDADSGLDGGRNGISVPSLGFDAGHGLSDGGALAEERDGKLGATEGSDEAGARGATDSGGADTAEGEANITRSDGGAELNAQGDASRLAHASPESGVDGGLTAAVLQAPVWAIDVAGALGTTSESLAVSVPYEAIEIDGDLSDWSEREWLQMSHRSTMGAEASRATAKDFSATLALRWTKAALYLAVVVLDDVHYNDYSGADLWNGDSLQVAFDAGEGRHPYDWEYGFALHAEGAEARSWWPSSSDLTHEMSFVVRRYDGGTVYEIAFEPAHLGVEAFPTEVRLSAAVNEADGETRVEALELVEGIVSDPKSGAAFVALRWSEPTSPLHVD